MNQEVKKDRLEELFGMIKEKYAQRKRVFVCASFDTEDAQKYVDNKESYTRCCLRDSILRGEAPFAPEHAYQFVFPFRGDTGEKTTMECGKVIMVAFDVVAFYDDYGFSLHMVAYKAFAENIGKTIVYRKIIDDTK